MGRTYSLTDISRDTELIGGAGRGAWEMAQHLDETENPALDVAFLVRADYHGHDWVQPEPRLISASKLEADTTRLIEYLNTLAPDHRFGAVTVTDWSEWFAAVHVYATKYPDSQFVSAFFE
jgi:hypothetical protein